MEKITYMEQEKVSIIMPVYNCEHFIAQAIESIFSQSYTNWELIIINDSSTDNTVSICHDFQKKDNRIHIINNNKQKGLAGALNTGLAIAQGSYIARADGDDINTPNRIADQMHFLKKNPNIAIVGSYYESFRDGQKPIIRKHPTNWLMLKWRFISNTFFCHPTVLFKKEVLTTVHEYPYTASEDFAFFSEIEHHFKGVNMNSVLLKYREHRNNYSTTKKESIEKSVYETFLKNYSFYRKDITNASIFFDFHHKRKLLLQHFFIIVQDSFIIAKSIISKEKPQLLDIIRLYMAIIADIIIATAYTILKRSYYFLYNFIKK